ncbi:MAG: single-stranded-DNA-specific exonuclease RecJ [Pseudomonadota bacterium]
MTCWSIVAENSQKQKKLSDSLNINPIIARLLVNRGIVAPDEARTFLNPSLSNIPNPFLLPDMEKAVARIVQAIEAGERIAVFGDFDADGICSTALLFRFFKKIGVHVETIIPHRIEHGYGLNLELITKNKPQLVITVDTGSNDEKVIGKAKKAGIDIIVTDHHTIEQSPKSAIATVNPKLSTNKFPDDDLSGCGVAFCLIMALRKSLRELGKLKEEPNLKDLLDLVAMATIADMVPLTGTNRILTKIGMEVIAKGSNPGISALLEVSSTSHNPTSQDIAFRLAPRINAAGRLHDASIALKLLISEDPVECKNIADELNSLNSKRQQTEAKIISDAHEILKNSKDNSGIVLHSEEWHLGVMGIAASKLANSYGTPVAIFAKDGDSWRGSVRSKADIDIMKVLGECSDLLIKFGGHKAAAGISIADENLELFKSRFDEICLKYFPENYEERLKIDALLNIDDITEKLIDDMDKMEPFGNSNPEPLFGLNNINVASVKVIKEKHLKLNLKGATNHIEAIGFGFGHLASTIGENTSIAFRPEFNTWQGVRSVQLRVREVRTSDML